MSFEIEEPQERLEGFQGVRAHRPGEEDRIRQRRALRPGLRRGADGDSVERGARFKAPSSPRVAESG